jgi:hypothetical protein
MDFAPKVQNPLSKLSTIKKGLISRVAENVNPELTTMTTSQIKAMDEETLKNKIKRGLTQGEVLSENEVKKLEADNKNEAQKFKNLELQVLQMEINNIIEERVNHSPLSSNSPQRTSPINGKSKKETKKSGNRS